MNMKKLSLILAILLALFSCAFAETVEPTAEPIVEAEEVSMAAEQITGLWDLVYVTSEGYMVQADAYGLVITLDLQQDGVAAMDYNGEVDDSMSWYIQDGRAYISGYSPEGEDVEILLSAAGVLEITDDIGTMIFTRPLPEKAE